jgi:type IV pilus assembly protein PilQ
MMRLNTFIQTRRRGMSLLLGLGALLLSAGAWADGAARSLQSLDFVSLGGNRVLLTLTLSSAAPEPVIFTIENPARLSLDLPNTRLDIADHYRKIGIGDVQAVGMAEGKGRTRVVVEMSSLLPHAVSVEGNKVLLQLGGGAPQGGVDTSEKVTAVASPVTPATARTSAGQISSIDFRRGEKGEGRIIVKLADDSTPVDVQEVGGKIVARFKNTGIPDELLKRLDVLDFATPVKYVDVRREGINTELVVTPVENSDFEQVAYQSNNLFTLELQPLTPERAEQLKQQQPQYKGKRISLSFQSVDIRSLLQIIADVAGTNMVISDSVKGDLAMRLQNVPWDQALDIILRTKGLGMRQQGNVMLVAPLAELAAREKSELEAEQQKVQLAPLRSEIIQVNYAKAQDLKQLITSSDKASLLSERGRISVDERTNTLIVLETREKIAEIRDLVSKLDIPVRQVLIESRIVNAKNNFSRELGTRFGLTTLGSSGNNLVSTSGTAAGTDQALTGTTPTQANRFNVNLPVTNPAGSIALGILGSHFLVDLELSAMQSEGRGEVISTPRVITANGKQAVIESGKEIPYQTTGGSAQGSTTSFKKASLQLTVTPNITPDNRVMMDLAVHNDTLGDNVATGAGQAPAINTQQVTTQVLVKSGDTVVLGGVYQNDTEKSVSKVPLLGDLPLLGSLFRTDTNSVTKAELLIFITPKILQDGLRVN